MISLIARLKRPSLILVPLALVATAFAPAADAVPALDTAFGNAGIVDFSLYPSNDSVFESAWSTQLQPDGKVLAAVQVRRTTVKKNTLPILRFNRDGKLDKTFGKNGVAWVTYRGTKSALFAKISLQPDGKIISFARGNNLNVARLNPNGKLDRTFGSGGREVLSKKKTHGVVLGISSASGGKTLIATSATLRKQKYLWLTRFKRNGSYDNSYGDHGVRAIKLDNQPSTGVRSVSFVGGEAIALVENTEPALPYARHCKVMRVLTTTGKPVTSFGGDGIADVPEPAGVKVNDCESAVASDGNIVVVGALSGSGASPREGGFVSVLKADGTPSAQFGTGGTIKSTSQLSQVVGLADGTILAIGNSGSGFVEVGDTYVTASLYTTLGTPVAGFGTAGTLQITTRPTATPLAISHGAGGTVLSMLLYSGNGTNVGLAKLTN